MENVTESACPENVKACASWERVPKIFVFLNCFGKRGARAHFLVPNHLRDSRKNNEILLKRELIAKQYQ